MIPLELRKAAFVALGKKMHQEAVKEKSELFEQARQKNPWFTIEFLRHSFSSLSLWLRAEKLDPWIASYSPSLFSRKIGVVMASNIPLVGFHDLLCILISGHELHYKAGSEDTILVKAVLHWLVEIEPAFSEFIFEKERLNQLDAYIATGSDNTARYFHYYFKNKPHIIRKNRNAVAVLNGKEEEKDLIELGKDVFTYYGMGCRNVSKLYLPKNFAIEVIMKTWEHFMPLANHSKYMNNYDYNRSVYIMNKIPIYDNGLIVLKEGESISSPLSVIHYQRYQDQKQVESELLNHREKIQCIVSRQGAFPGSIAFGQAQKPDLTDYPDKVDLMKWLGALE